jgi:hypothetical protein
MHTVDLFQNAMDTEDHAYHVLWKVHLCAGYYQECLKTTCSFQEKQLYALQQEVNMHIT